VIEQAHSLNISALCTSPSSSSIAFSGSRDYSVKLWDLHAQVCVSEYSSPRNIVTSLAYDAEGSERLFQGSEDLCVRVWDLRSSSGSQPAAQYAGYVYFPLCLALQSDGFLLASGCKGFNSMGCGVVIWDLRNPSRPLHEFKGHSQDVTACQFSSSHRSLLTASKDGSVRSWDISSLSPGPIMQLGRRPLSSLCALNTSGSKSSFVVAAMDGSLSVVTYSRSISSSSVHNATMELVYSTEGLVGEESNTS
jgi:WD40 repeat protein